MVHSAGTRTGSRNERCLNIKLIHHPLCRFIVCSGQTSVHTGDAVCPQEDVFRGEEGLYGAGESDALPGKAARAVARGVL